MAGLCAYTALFIVAPVQGLDPVSLTGDSRSYKLLAENILRVGTFSLSLEAPYAPESFRSPGYPLFLSGLYGLVQHWAAVLLLQAALLSVVPVLLYLLMKPYHERAAWWGSIIFIFEPTRLFLSVSLLSDALFAALFLGSLLLLERARMRASWRHAALAGALLGISMLVRPIAMFLPALYVAYLAFFMRPWKESARFVAVLVLSAAIMVSPWALRNYAHFGSSQISSVGAANLMLYNAPEFVRAYPSERGTALLEQFKLRHESLPERELLSLSRAGEFTAAFKEVIRGQEVSYLAFHAVKTLPFFITDGLREIARLMGVEFGAMPNYTSALLRGDWALLGQYLAQGGLATVLLVAGSGAWALATALCAWILWRALRGKEEYMWVFFAALVVYFALLTGPVSNARYRLPVEGFIIVAAAAVLLDKSKK